MADFLKGLPCHNEHNFTRFQAEATCKTAMKKPSVYICTKDHPSEQVITTEKTNILLRYLHQQWDRKVSNAHKKRDSSHANLENTEGSPASKIPRLNPSSDSSNS